MRTALQIMGKAKMAVDEAINITGSNEEYEFVLHPTHKEIIAKYYFFPKVPDGELTLFGYPVRFDPYCPLDRFYFMKPIHLDPEAEEDNA